MIFVASLGGYQFVMLECAGYRGFSLAQVKRLHQIIESAETKRVDRALNRLHPADHYDDRIRGSELCMRDHLQTGHAAHGDVADYQLIVFLSELGECFFRRRCLRAFVRLAEEVAQHAANFDFVVDNQEKGLRDCFHHILIWLSGKGRQENVMEGSWGI
jgi:hypothetical protein